jgi:hypothetical protein
MGHPTGSPKLHMAMTAKRRNKLRKLAEEIPVPEVHGDHEGTLMVGWGSTYGPIHDAVTLGREQGEKKSARYICAISSIAERARQNFSEVQAIVTVEMNDQGVYGYGQLATILRALLRTENHEFHQDRWPHFSGERNFGRRIQGQSPSLRDTSRAKAPTCSIMILRQKM